MELDDLGGDVAEGANAIEIEVVSRVEEQGDGWQHGNGTCLPHNAQLIDLSCSHDLHVSVILGLGGLTFALTPG